MQMESPRVWNWSTNLKRSAEEKREYTIQKNPNAQDTAAVTCWTSVGDTLARREVEFSSGR